MYKQEEKTSGKSNVITVIQKKGKLEQSYKLEDNRPNDKKSILASRNIHVTQGYFDTSGYRYAAQMWQEALDSVTELDNRLDIRTERGDSYIDVLKTNLENKARKAGTTIAGEAYETKQWKQPKGRSIVIGPGGTSGADLLTFESLQRGERAYAPTEFGEVKSASKPETYLDGIANAYHQRGQTNIIMYTTDDNIAPDGCEFTRNGKKYAISNSRNNGGVYGGMTYTLVARIELPDQDMAQFLYTVT